MLPPASAAKPPKKVIVAIHGIGSQTRGATIRAVAHRFGNRPPQPLPLMPVGFFEMRDGGEIKVSRLDVAPPHPLADVGFVEVFWADIPRKAVQETDVLEETKAWGKTVVGRAQASYLKLVQNKKLEDADFSMAAGVIEEVIEGIEVLDNLFFLASKAGIFHFELATVLRDYVDDVQVVTEFEQLRNDILLRFHTIMAGIIEHLRSQGEADPELYVVAHSEGTVVSFLAMLQAIEGKLIQTTDSTGKALKYAPTEWIKQVRGFMTFGSPIDKHLVLWPTLWRDLDLQGKGAVGKRIEWRNYYDLGDPIGFKLDTARQFLAEKGCDAFNFQEKHDRGFSRYYFPGKAHVDYWEDADVFGHFMDDVVFADSVPPKEAVEPKSKWWVDRVSMTLPYLFSALLAIAAVYVMYKGVTNVPEGVVVVAQDAGSQCAPAVPVTPADCKTAVGSTPSSVSYWSAARSVVPLGLLLLFSTIAARIPRLVKRAGFRWHLAATGYYALGVALVIPALPPGVRIYIGESLGQAFERFHMPVKWFGALLLALIALFITLSGWWAPKKPRRGRIYLVAAGSIAVLAVVIARGYFLSNTLPFWPVLLGAVGFLYLWWLSIIVFDLTFIWHRYIRRSVIADTLSYWGKRVDAKPRAYMGLGGRKA